MHRRTARPGVDRRSVLFIADRAEPRLGMERALADLLIALREKRDVQVVLIAGEAPQDRPYACSSLGNRPGFAGRVRAMARLRRLVRTFEGGDVVAVGVWAACTVAVATLGVRRRLILWEHSLLPWRLVHERKTAAAAIALRFLSWRFRHVVAVSEGAARTTRPFLWPHAAVTVIPNVVESDALKPQHNPPNRPRPQSPVRIVGVGTINKRKNWPLAVRAMRLLPDDYVLSIAGEGPDKAAVRDLVIRLGLTGRVTLLGHVQDGHELFSQADLALHTSHAETFGYVLVEAAEAAVPVVALRKPVMSETLPELVCGVLCDVPEPQAVADAILAAARQSDQFDFAAAAGRRAMYLSAAAVAREWDLVLEADLLKVP